MLLLNRIISIFSCPTNQVTQSPLPLTIPTKKNTSKAGGVENCFMVFDDCPKLSTFSGRNRVLEVSSCKADAADRADDGQRVQDDRRHSQVVVILVIMMTVMMVVMVVMVMLVMMAMMTMLLMMVMMEVMGVGSSTMTACGAVPLN